LLCLQAQQALTVAAACIAWGSPSISYATLYDSTTTAKNTATAHTLAGAAAGRGTYQDRGAALVDKEGKDTVLYAALKSYAKQANAWVEAQIEVRRLRGHTCTTPAALFQYLDVSYQGSIDAIDPASHQSRRRREHCFKMFASIAYTHPADLLVKEMAHYRLLPLQ
jgi:hypothetical protein